MIRNKKEIEEKLIERLTQKTKEYVKNMDEKSNGEYYPIDVIVNYNFKMYRNEGKLSI